MDFTTIGILAGAGLLGGIMNALAGGATLITFPAMLAAGLPPIVANASSAFAVSPGHLAAVFADRAALTGKAKTMLPLLGASLLGGCAGSLLLLSTPEAFFTAIVPGLIGLATLLFALGGKLRGLRNAAAGDMRPGTRAALMLPACLYGGYFGAGLGIVLLAILTVTGGESLRLINTVKNLLASAVSAGAIAIFILNGTIAWPQTLVMLGAALAGGWLGGRLTRILPPGPVRLGIIALGLFMTGLYAYRLW